MRGRPGELYCEELPHQWKDSIVPIHRKGDKTDCSNYRGISLLSTVFNLWTAQQMKWFINEVCYT
jgi:hypothetical protein